MVCLQLNNWKCLIVSVVEYQIDSNNHHKSEHCLNKDAVTLPSATLSFTCCTMLLVQMVHASSTEVDFWSPQKQYNVFLVATGLLGM